jgi:dolichyl-diphosphooligosaccharide--protein glycosyltransferase
MEVDQNWRDALDWLKNNTDKKALVATWWDPGHIIAGYTGLRVHADGAHCPPESCVPYNHNIRIQDMGKIFATSSEDESVSILKKYQQLTPEQCQQVKQEFGDIVPKDACDKIPEIYLIASADLMGKYYWLSFFGTGTGGSYYQLSYTGPDQSGLPTYGGILTLLQQNNTLMAVINSPQQGIRNALVKEIVYFDDTGTKHLDFSNYTNTLEGMAWATPSFGILGKWGNVIVPSTVIYMPPEIKDSIFTKLFFFDGQGLSKFKLVFNNPEVKIYKVFLG